MRYLLSFLLLFSFLYAGDTSLKTMKKEKRVAFIIGNGDYDEAPIKNAASDAQKLKRFLKKNKFEVIHIEDASKRDIIKSLRTFNAKMQQDGIALFYFAGHSVQVRNKNYLIPIEAAIESDHHVLYEAIELNAILNKMRKSGSRLNIVMIDSAHTNPFGNIYRADKKGLAPIKGGRYMDVLLSTAPNRITKPYSFISRLIPILEQKGISNKEAFKEFNNRAKQSSIQLSNQDFYFNLPNKLVSPEVLLWTKTLAANSDSAYTAFISKYPNSKYTDAAKSNRLGLKRKVQEKRKPSKRAKVVKERKIEPVKKEVPFVAKIEEPEIEEEEEEDEEEEISYVDPMMGLIKAGSVTVGSQESGSQYEITINKDYYIQHYEVSNVEYKEFLKDTKEDSTLSHQWAADFQPAVNVSWNDANKYAQWLSKVTGRKYRLPTEEEWEYAARAGASTTYFWGDRDTSHRKDAWRAEYPDNAHDFTWIKTNAESITHHVATKKPNNWGINNILGNASEWCTNKRTNEKVLRGGSWSSTPAEITLSSRLIKNADYSNLETGFRLVQEK